MSTSPEIQKPDMNKTEISRFLFGQNLEHTRACIYGGLSAQLLKNRKFAGKPSLIGVASEWEPFGKDAFYELSQQNTYTRHSTDSNSTMFRLNELGCQRIQHFSAMDIAGIRQSGLPLCAGKQYIFRIALRETNTESCPVLFDIRAGEKMIFEAQTQICSSEWEVREFRFSCDTDADAELRIGMMAVNSLEIGMTSLIDSENWHGMRWDVVEHLRAIGTTLIRWPGGNFAGEYRWRDGLLDVDRRAPLQSATEIETQPYSAGFDNHELDTDDIVALCREIGAEPFFTINAVWDSPEESAAWVEYCNGATDTPMGKCRAERGHAEPYHVKFWSLGNEMGFRHMEGPRNPEAYASMVSRHADTMRLASPEITLFSSGPLPSQEWTQKALVPLAEKAPIVSFHYYNNVGSWDFTTPERTESIYQRTIKKIEIIETRLTEIQRYLPENMAISLDEWNLWYIWYRQKCALDGMFTARFFHFLLKNFRKHAIACACFFQPVNEGAIEVKARESCLTAMGQVMRLMARHAGGIICTQLVSDDCFASHNSDGTIYLSIINDSFHQTQKYKLPFSGKLEEGVMLTANSVLPGSRFKEIPYTSSNTEELEIPQLSILAIRISP